MHPPCTALIAHFLFPTDHPTRLSRARPFIGVDAVPEATMDLLTAGVTATKLNVQRIAASLEVNRRIRAPIIPDRPVNAVGAENRNRRRLAAASRRAAKDAQTGARLVSKGSRARECGRAGARVDAVLFAVSRGGGSPFGAAGPNCPRSEHGSGSHAAGGGDVEGDFGVVGAFGAVEVFEFEELGL